MKKIVLLVAVFAAATFTPAAAEQQTALLLENIGLKNTYQVVFHTLDAQSADGVVQVIPQDDDNNSSPNQMLPFHADIKPDPKDKNVELLDVKSIGLVEFFPPADKKDATPRVVWKLIGRQGKAPKLMVRLWGFGTSAWTVQEMEFVKPKP